MKRRNCRAEIGSRLRVGSSSSSTRGDPSSARAMSSRWRIPEENSPTIFSTGVGELHQLEHLLDALGPRRAAQPEQRGEVAQVVARSDAPEDGALVGHGSADHPAHRARVGHDIGAVNRRGPRVGDHGGREHAHQRRLPRAIRAEEAEQLALRDFAGEMVRHELPARRKGRRIASLHLRRTGNDFTSARHSIAVGRCASGTDVASGSCVVLITLKIGCADTRPPGRTFSIAL